MKKVTKKVIDGKVDGPTDLYDLLGEHKKSPYAGINAEQYKREIEGMDSSDLYSHAIEIGLIPIDNRRVLLSRLEKEFSRHRIKMTSSQSVPALEGKRAKKFLDVLHGKK